MQSHRYFSHFKICPNIPERCCWNCRWKHVAGGMLYCRKNPVIANKLEWDPLLFYKCWGAGRPPLVMNLNDGTVRRWKVFASDLFGDWFFLGYVTGNAALAKQTGEHQLRVWQKKHKRLLFDITFEVVAGAVVKVFVPNNQFKGVKDD